VTVHGAGRTDAGVHALGQVAHIDLGSRWSAETVRNALNHFLRPLPIAVLAVEAAADGFHARFSATGRRYYYRIINRRPPLALEAGRAWQVARSLDAATMHEAAQALLGRHDFSTFRAALCQAQSPIRTLDRLDVMREGDDITIHAAARSFLHHQVRNMVGSLVMVGSGKWRPAALRAALAACDRAAGGPTAPPDGLYFVAACYDACDRPEVPVLP